MVSAVYPGSFDPVTNGHYDVIERCSSLFDEVTVLVMINPDKSYMFSVEERMELIRNQCQHLQNVKICSYKGLLVNYMKENHEKIMIKGVRNCRDYEYEQSMAIINKTLDDNTETLLLLSNPMCSHISSSAVKQMASLGASIAGYVSSYVEDAIEEKLKFRHK